MRAQVCKRFTFDAAHKLPNHDGKCRNLHGHTYTVEVCCIGKIENQATVDDAPNPKFGMVIDFGDLKTYWKENLEPFFDHRYLNDTLPFTTTAENIAVFICKSFLTAGFPISFVRVWETPNSYAEVTGADVRWTCEKVASGGDIRSHYPGGGG